MYVSIYVCMSSTSHIKLSRRLNKYTQTHTDMTHYAQSNNTKYLVSGVVQRDEH